MPNWDSRPDCQFAARGQRANDAVADRIDVEQRHRIHDDIVLAHGHDVGEIPSQPDEIAMAQGAELGISRGARGMEK